MQTREPTTPTPARTRTSVIVRRAMAAVAALTAVAAIWAVSTEAQPDRDPLETLENFYRAYEVADGDQIRAVVADETAAQELVHEALEHRALWWDNQAECVAESSRVVRCREQWITPLFGVHGYRPATVEVDYQVEGGQIASATRTVIDEGTYSAAEAWRVNAEFVDWLASRHPSRAGELLIGDQLDVLSTNVEEIRALHGEWMLGCVLQLG